jgi:mono/diheme cytochrome c family protein
MQRLRLPRLFVRSAVLAAVGAASASCAPSSPAPPESRESELVAYLNDTAARRSELEASLVNPANGYSQLRLEHYATGADGDWDRLPAWNPVVEPVGTAELGAEVDDSVALSAAARALALPDDPVNAGESALVALGKAAFERYPIQLAPYFDGALATEDAASAYGLWLDEERGVGGLVRAQMADGTTSLALTCSTCHAKRGPSGIENGLPNAALDLGAALLDAGAAAAGSASSGALEAWGPGRLDVTTPTGVEPVRIPDLRPLRFQTHLHHDATLAVLDGTTLAIRIETLAITSSGQVWRPPRVVAWALARYLETLGATLPDESSARAASPAGSQIFAEECASCHRPPALTGAPVPLAVVGTDPALGLSADRGTGTYRVPSLHGVSSRGPLLHDASVASLEDFFDPARLSSDFAGRLHGSGAIAGHRFGLELQAGDRAALLGYLHAL